jgi:hypothetical protein
VSVEACSWAWAQDVQGADKLVLLAIANEVRSDGRTSYPGHKLIATRCGKTPRAVQDSIRRLEEGGLLERERRFRPNGSRTSDLYALPLPEDVSGRKSPPEVERSHHRKPTSYPEPEGEPEGETNGGAPSTSEEWDEWLGDYREVTGNAHVKGSESARKAFNARRRDGYTLDDLKRATRGCHGDEYLRDHGHAIPTTILRPSKIDRYIQLAPKPAGDDEVERERAEALAAMNGP